MPRDPRVDPRPGAMKIHWRTEDRWLREFKAGQTIADIAWEYAPWETEDSIAEHVVIDEVEDGIRRAILRRERRREEAKP